MSTTLDDVAEALREALGADAVKDGDSERDLHSADLSFHERMGGRTFSRPEEGGAAGTAVDSPAAE